MKVKNLIFWFFLACMTLVQVSCVECEQSNNLNCSKTELKILVDDYPPFVVMKGDELTGLSVDILNKIIKELGLNVKPKIEVWDKAYHEGMHQEGVVLGSVIRTEKREHLFYWVGPQAKIKTFLFAKKGSELAGTVRSLEDAKKLEKIGTNTEYYSEEYLKDKGFLNLQSDPCPQKTMNRLFSGEVDAAVFNYLDACAVTKELGHSMKDLIPLYLISEDEVYIAISKKTSKDITSKWQNAFDSLKAKGILHEMHDKWIPLESYSDKYMNGTNKSK